MAKKKAVRGRLFTGYKESVVDLQDGKLAGSHNKDGGEHEANADSKHCQGCEEQPSKDQQPVPSTHCAVWLAKISVIDRQTSEARLLHPRQFAQELPFVTSGHGAQPAQVAGADDFAQASVSEQ